VGQPNWALSIAFVGVRTMHSLNRRYLRRDCATDVLSFRYEEVMMDGLPFLGEVVIAPEIAVRQATRFQVCSERELRKLLVHGILHLLGYDHETDSGQMNRFQTRLLRRRFFMNSPVLADLELNR
jgi:probable rRNA maturation factor